MMKVCSEFVLIVLIDLLLISVPPIQCRQAIKPIEDINIRGKTKVIQYEPQTFSDTYDRLCSLNIQRDLPKPNIPQPLYIVPNTTEIWNPDRNGYLEIPEGSDVELFCSYSFINATIKGDRNIFTNDLQTNQATCIGGGNIFSWYGEKYFFGQFVCPKQVRYTVQRLGERCAKSGELFRVGFNITRYRFIESMRICYDDKALRNHYTHHSLFSGSIHFQRFVQRLNFSKAGFFQDHNINSYYTQRNQKRIAFKLFNSNDTVTKYFNGSDLYLARGHLAAKADFIYASQQRSTFNFFNVAPQWQSFNAGQWAALETAVRKYVSKMDLEVDCYTGTWGTLHLKSPNDNADERPFYLASDKNNNGILPVPKLFYRVIVDRKTPSRGIALLGVNNPHLSLRDILDSYIICKDITANIPWLRWIRNNDLKKGYLYACSVAQLYRVIKVLPKNLRQVVDVLV